MLCCVCWCVFLLGVFVCVLCGGVCLCLCVFCVGVFFFFFCFLVCVFVCCNCAFFIFLFLFKVIGAGGFNNSDDPSMRRTFLEQLLKDNTLQTDQSAEVHTLKEINQRMARTEAEYKLFKQMDEERMREREMRRAAGEVVLPEMVTLDELPAWLTAPPAPVDPEKAKFKDLEGGMSEAFGRGKRKKNAEVEYTDQLDEDEFCMLMEQGASQEDIKKYIAERNARRANGNDEHGEGDDDGDADHVLEADDQRGDNLPKKSRGNKSVPGPLDAEEALLQSKAIQLLDELKSLKDPNTGRVFADKWRLIFGPEGPPEKKRGRPPSKPMDLTDVGNKLKKQKYKSLNQLVADLEKMFSYLMDTLEVPEDKAEALEGLKKLHECSDRMLLTGTSSTAAAIVQNEQDEEDEAAAILAGGGGGGPLKKMKEENAGD